MKLNRQDKKFLIFFIANILVSAFLGLSFGFLASRSQVAAVLKTFNQEASFKSFLEPFLRPFQKQEKESATKKEIEAPAIIFSQEEAIIKVVEDSTNSVVSVIGSKDLPVLEQFFSSPFGNDPFFQQFFQEFQTPQYRQKGLKKQDVSSGTGFFISSDGLVLTNKHVVEDEEASYRIITNSGENLEAKVLARDPIQDLAVLKVGKNGFKPLNLGDSGKIKIGQSVIAIGNALGEFSNTVSSGIVSGLRRSLTASSAAGIEQLEELIQTDAAINPGNSGGPLLNLKGEVIGINTAMARGAENIGFAIPINKAKKDLEDVKTKGKISYPFLGVRYIILNADIAKKNNLAVDYGALIQRGENQEDLAVVPGSPADQAGILENDIILEMDKIKIDKDNSLAKLISQKQVGDEVALKILRKGKEIILKTILKERK
ncbi:MAG: trypsin-like peptidase domain-containing protein [Parcubacteria group bacterium]|nr:trypsin-like peptidase domain-containing protein [Parcubacteria group bacterium]